MSMTDRSTELDPAPLPLTTAEVRRRPSLLNQTRNRTISDMSNRILVRALRRGGTADELTAYLYSSGSALATDSGVRAAAKISTDVSAVSSAISSGATLPEPWSFGNTQRNDWFYLTRPTRDLGLQHESVIHKLYVSPTLSDRTDVLPVIAKALAHADTAQFKVGRGVQGWLRPDWLVAYYPTFAQLRVAALSVAKACPDVTWQGVPFTSELGHGPGISAGVDPPSEVFEVPISWRIYVCSVLAHAIVKHSETPGSHFDPETSVRSVLDITIEAGIDVRSWRPTPALTGAWTRATPFPEQVAPRSLSSQLERSVA
jgi:hypothetical protein